MFFPFFLQVNCGFEILRTHIPSAAKQKKMSKVDTLRHAVDYIQKLRKILREQSLEDIEDIVDSDGAPVSAEAPLPATKQRQSKTVTARKGGKQAIKPEHQHQSPPPPSMLMLPKPGVTSYALPMTSSSTYSSAVSPAPSSQSSYSAPLTPRTPTTPTPAGVPSHQQMDFLTNNPHLAPQGFSNGPYSCNESGYESPSSSSFYCQPTQHQQTSLNIQHQASLPSPAPSSVMSSYHTLHHHPHHPQQHQSPDSLLYSPKASATHPHPMHPHQQQGYQQPSHPANSEYHVGYYEGGTGTNSEEDELLDVIAKWQDD